MARTCDQGLADEPEMILRMWPGGAQPETAQPYILDRRSAGRPARVESWPEDGVRSRDLRADTGRSLGTPRTRARRPRWRLYTGAIRVSPGMTLRAKAIRYGYKESKETRTMFLR